MNIYLNINQQQWQILSVLFWIVFAIEIGFFIWYFTRQFKGDKRNRDISRIILPLLSSRFMEVSTNEDADKQHERVYQVIYATTGLKPKVILHHPLWKWQEAIIAYVEYEDPSQLRSMGVDPTEYRFSRAARHLETME